MPEGTEVFTIGPDGKAFLATTPDSTDPKKFHLSLVDRDGKKTKQLTALRSNLAGSFTRPKLSPDGSRVLFQDVDSDEKLEKGMQRFPRLYVYDLKTEKREKLAEVALDAFVQGFAWSPDSRRVAYSWKRMEPGVPLAFNLDDVKNPKLQTETETHLTVADANGKNPKTVMSAKAPSGPIITIGSLDWR